MAETAKEVCSLCLEPIESTEVSDVPWAHVNWQAALGKPCYMKVVPASTLPPTAAEPSEPAKERTEYEGLVRFLNQQAEPSEPKADGFDEWFGASGYVESFRPNALEIWSVGEQSGVRKGMQRALELVRKYREGRAEPRAVYAAKDCEASILAEMEKAI